MYQKIRKVVDFVRRKFPLSKPVAVRLIDLKKHYDGLCIDYDEKYVLELDKYLNHSQLIDTFLHEYAHASVIDVSPDRKEDHDSLWGVHYARIYRAYLKEFHNYN